MKTLFLVSALTILSGCSAVGAPAQSTPYDNPQKGYVVYRPISEVQRWDGIYLEGFVSRGAQYVENCVSINRQLSPVRPVKAEARYDDIDQVVYLKYDYGPRYVKCDINREAVRIDAERFIEKNKISQREKSEEESRQISAGERVEFGGYVATRNNLLGSISLACYTGSLDSGGMLSVSKDEQISRYQALLGLYKGDAAAQKRVTGAFEFARRNLSDRYPLDDRGQYRASVCDQMVMRGKL